MARRRAGLGPGGDAPAPPTKGASVIPSKHGGFNVVHKGKLVANHDKKAHAEAHRDRLNEGSTTVAKVNPSAHGGHNVVHRGKLVANHSSKKAAQAHADRLNLATEAAGVVLDLAGKWKHGWIPLDAVAALVKAKKYKGGGGGAPGGGLPTGKNRRRNKGRTGEAVMARRAPAQGRPKRAPTIEQSRKAAPGYVPEAHRAAARDAIRMKASELRPRAEAGDKIAQAELTRRADARKAKGAATPRVVRDAQDRHRSLEGKRVAADEVAGVRSWSDDELHAAITAHGSDTRLGTISHAELERRGKPAALRAPRDSDRIEASHPLGATVDARQPGVADRVTRGKVVGHEGRSVLQVEYQDRHGQKVTGRFNASHTAVVADSPGDKAATPGVGESLTADLLAEVRAFDANPPSIRDGAAGYRERVSRYNAAKLELGRRQIPGARSGGTAGDGYNERADVSRETSRDVPPEGYAVVEDKVSPAPGFLQGTGRYSFTDPQGRKHYVGRSERVAARRAHDHLARTSEAEASAKAVRDQRTAAEAAAAAERADFRARMAAATPAKIPQATNEDARLMQAAAALHFSESSRNGVKTADVKLIAESDSPHITPESRALAQSLLPERGYEAAKGHLVGRSDEELRGIRTKLAGSPLPEHEKAGAERYIAEQLREGAPASPAEPAAHSGITIEHSGDGTVVHGTSRSDTATNDVLKRNGFKWSARLNGWYLPRTWGEATRAQRVSAVRSALGDKVSVDRGSVARSGTAAERADARVQRDAELATQHTQRAGKLHAVADDRFGAARRVQDGIPLGQPILVGHHSEGRHRRDIARIDTNMRKGVEAHTEAQAAEQRAQSAAARVKLATNPQALSRRIDRNSAELRRLDRMLNGTGKAIHGMDQPHPPGEHRDRLQAMRDDLAGAIEHDRQTLAATGAPSHSRETVKPGDYVRIRGSLMQVDKASPKTVTVKSHGLTLKYPYSEIQTHATSTDILAKASDAQLLAVTRSAPGTSLAAEAQRELDGRRARGTGKGQ